MKNDITTRQDIELLVNSFYNKVKTDPVIGHFFAHVNWERHLPVMYNFWENVIFFTGTYTGNPMTSHQRLNNMFPLKEEHFKQWLALFTETIDGLFEGEKAELAKQRALSISTVMRIKILQGGIG